MTNLQNYILNNKLSFNKGLLVLLLFFLYIPYKFTFINENGFIYGSFSDFGAMALYTAEVLLIIFFLFNVKTIQFDWFFTKVFACLLILSGVYVVFFTNNANASLLLASGLTWIIFYSSYEIGRLINYLHLTKTLLYSLIFLSFGISIVALIQFYTQSSLGLGLLHEPVLNGSATGIAKIALDAGVFIRPYALFGHSNILGMFALLGFVITTWEFFNLQSSTWNYHVRIYILQTVLLATLITIGLSLSRSSWIALVVTIVYLLFVLHENIQKDKIAKIGLLCILALAILIPHRDLFISRAIKAGDTAIEQRIDQYAFAKSSVSTNPLFGTGMGQDMLHMKQSLPKIAPSWQIQPVHNTYLLLIVEYGLLISGVILITYGRFVLLLIKKSRQSSLLALFSTVLIAFSVLMLFDHYFVTYIPCVIMLGLILGLSREVVRE